MPQKLGKHKRRDQVLKQDSDPELKTDQVAHQRLQDLLQQHFEAKFKPLEGLDQKIRTQPEVEAQPLQLETESDWTGISDGEDEEPAQVVHYDMAQSSRVEVPKEEQKIFMSNKPPSAANRLTLIAKRKQNEQVNSEEAVTDAENLKKDLALQRLLKESHLLESQSSLSVSGQNRHKALDLRLQNLGSKSSVYTQQKMPLAQRKGIIAKAAQRDGGRRREAKENGIILEKAVRGKKKPEARRQRGIGAPSIGKFRGGMLKLSREDVAKIVGPKKTLKGKGRK